MIGKETHSSDSAGGQHGLFLMTNSFETGGSEQQFVALARSLQGTQFRTEIGCIARRGLFLDGFDDVAEFSVGGSLYGIRSLKARRQLVRHLRQSDIEVAHAFDFYTNLLLIPAARWAGVPAVIGSQRQLGDLLTPAKSRAQLSVLRWCDRVVCNSRAAADRLIANGMPETKVTVIANGLPPTAFAKADPAFHRSASLLRVGMIARMNSPLKNHSTFLRAAARVHSKLSGTEFLLAGDGPLRPELERQAEELGIRNHVQFLGDRRDIPEILASLDVSVLPSASESLSNAILESMAAGVPVVATDVGGNSELVTAERGILVPVGDEDRLAGAVEQLLMDSEMRTGLGRRAKTFAESNFTIATMSRRHTELYSEILEAKAERRTARVSPGNRNGKSFRPLRVAIVAASSRYVGGQSVQADLLLKRWQNDPEVEASFIPIDPMFPPGLKWAESIPVLRTIVRQPFYLGALWGGIRNVDIAHVFSASYWSFLIAPTPALMMARLLGKRTLTHYHSGEARDHLRRSRTAHAVLARTDRLVVPSGYLVDVFREFGLRALAVPNIVDLPQFSFRARHPLRPHLVCTRGFHPYYSIDIVVRAFAEVKRQYPEARLDLVGGGPLEEQIRALVEQLNLSDVSFAGVVSRQEIGKFYDRADIFINASCLDNMPVSILEAFACGTPVVSTAPESMRYLVEDGRTGLLSPSGDAQTLAQNVIRLLQDPDLSSRIAVNAYEQSKNYHWAAVRGQWLDLYRSLASREQRTRELASQA